MNFFGLFDKEVQSVKNCNNKLIKNMADLSKLLYFPKMWSALAST